MTASFSQGDSVRHSRFGLGEVAADMGQTVIVRFQHGLEQVARDSLHRQQSLSEKLESACASGAFDDPLTVLARVQASAIRSLHDQWGVFANSRIELLPHQLWVCQQVNQTWPPRMLIADDVGLGKTIEAGMILSPLIARGRVRRLLILCPASLVRQWQDRMKAMFDIRLALYSPDQDTVRTPFWAIHDRSVASFQTLRLTSGDRQKRLLEAEPWDLILVDEAHHLNDDEATGASLGYRLIEQLNSHRKMQGLLFFTGTPHRGKNFGFLSLLSLLRPDIAAFDAKNSSLPQALPYLPEVMIRNNKATVTDMEGKRLFQRPSVAAETYSYSPEEQHFYDQLTNFILQGEMYARTLTRTQSEAVALTLTTLQKLASSSVAAIRRALVNRLASVQSQNQEIEELFRQYQEVVRESANGDETASDTIGELDEKLAEARLGLLMNNEEEALRTLLTAADLVTHETKIQALLRAIETRFAERSVLFFTEYKATQSLVMSALIEHYGNDCVAFINGDGVAREVRLQDGSQVSRTMSRAEAAARFNRGEVRFLVATEAAGEGIDLQSCCHTLIHVDLPWNPMRLHQRVGRINRFGQKHAVEVLSLRNPDTVEGRIWNLLDIKTQQIGLAFDAVMDEPEDLMQLVLGMTRPTEFARLFAEAPRQRSRLEEWFAKNTSGIGGRDIVTLVQEIVGNSRRFDFGQSSSRIPKVDLPDLRPFFETALALGGRRPQLDSNGSLSFRTPEVWREDRHDGAAIRPSYERVTFERNAANDELLLGVGSPLMNAVLRLHESSESTVALLPAELSPELDAPLVVARLYSEETLGPDGPQPSLVAAKVPWATTEPVVLWNDEELLRFGNKLTRPRRSLSSAEVALPPSASEVLLRGLSALNIAARNGTIPHAFRYPAIEPFAVLMVASDRPLGGR